MPTGPAARITDLTAHGSPLVPGPPSPNVLIGKLPAWLGMTAAAAAALAATIATEAKNVAKKTATATAAAGTPAGPAAEAHKLKKQAQKGEKVSAGKTGGGTLSINLCPLFPLPHVQGVVITPSQTVLINNWGACRIGDIIQEVTAVNAIAMGEFSVIIGG